MALEKGISMIRILEISENVTKITEVGVWTKEGWKSQKLNIRLFANSYRKNIAKYLFRIVQRLYLGK